MQLYTAKDIELVEKEIDNIVERIEKTKIDVLGPSEKEQMETRREILDANKVVMEYIKTNKRKVYGGTAHNKAIIAKDPADAFYDDTTLPDIDIYSPDPIGDLFKLCDTLYEKGFNNISGIEALHKETYKVYVNKVNVIDLSYVPRNIYNRIPFLEIDGINYIHPSFAYIDFYRMMTEPYFSSFRWKSKFPRLYILQKHYPFNKPTKGLNAAYNVPANIKKEVNDINKIIIDMIKNTDTYIVVGQYAYNHFLGESEIMNDKKLGSKYKLIDTPFMQIISTNYIPDTIKILNQLVSAYKKDITYVEYYPLWMYTGYNTIIYYKSFPVLHITSHNNKCIPVRRITAICCINGKTEKLKDATLNIGSFDIVLFMNLISGLRTRVNQIEDKYHYHNIMTSHLAEIRNYYLEKNKKTLLDDTLFQSFIDTCIGDTMDPAKETALQRDKRYKEGKRVMFKYNPEKPRSPPDFQFANTSGNEVRTPINYKIKKYYENPKLLEDFVKKSYDEKVGEDESEPVSDSESNTDSEVTSDSDIKI